MNYWEVRSTVLHEGVMTTKSKRTYLHFQPGLPSEVHRVLHNGAEQLNSSAQPSPERHAGFSSLYQHSRSEVIHLIPSQPLTMSETVVGEFPKAPSQQLEYTTVPL